MKLVTGTDKALSQVCKDVKQGEDVKYLTDEMFAQMRNNNGAGLAANQLGVTKRIITVATDHLFSVIINPVLSDGRYPKQSSESCLSFPGMSKKVARFNRITVTGFDENWKPITKKLKAFTAFVVQHEVDHLNGITLNDK